MSLQQLEAFFWVVNLGSFSAAADRLYVTQTTVSMRIKELESSLGVSLFDRSKRSAHATAAGLELMQYARRILDLTAEIKQKIASPDSFSGQVRIGVAEVVSITWLPKFIEAISADYPNVRFEIDQALTGELMDSLRKGSIDLMLAPGRVPTPNMTTSSLGTVQFAWMASPALGLGGHVLTAAELARCPVVGLTQESYHHAEIEDWFRRANARCHYQVRCKSMAVAASMVIAGMGVSYLPLRCYASEVEHGKMQVLRTSPIPAVEFITAVSSNELDPLAIRMADLAVQVSDFDRSSVSAF
jgi:DNA-binding transcriptional LysR family regulator